MTVFMCRRDTGFVPPNRALYGQRNGNLIFPLDLAFSDYAAPGTMAPPGPPILGAGILELGGNTIATIASYDWPLAGKIVPIVTAIPDPAVIDLSQVFQLPSNPPPAIPAASFPIRVKVTNANNLEVSGTIKGFTTVPYLDTNHEIDVYEAQFDTPLFGENRGLPVVLTNDPGVLVGMVIITSPIDGAVNTYIARI